MTLDNLARIGRLKSHVATKDEIADLLAAARRNLDDAHAENISAENRFDAAYKCILQAELVGLMAQGFRPDTKSAGHHATVIQSLPKTIGIDVQRVVVLNWKDPLHVSAETSMLSPPTRFRASRAAETV